jgi:uncharacterized surface protein with fasciclin (FAS1) repeats
MDRGWPGERCRAVSLSEHQEFPKMNRFVLPLAAAAAALSLNACDKGGQKANEPAAAQTGEAKKAAGEQTIAAGLDQNSRFFAAAKSAGLDATLAGPGPYTVLVPDDAAFAKLPKATIDAWAKPESRAQLTGVLTYHILPGTVLADDIGKAIDNGKGKAVLATMGGGTLTATREGGKIVLADSAGDKATIVGPDEKRSNGVVHHIDTVLMPAKA